MNPEPRFVVVATLEHLPNGAFLRVIVDGHGLDRGGCRSGAKKSSGKPQGLGFHRPLEHDPEKWKPVFGKDHAPMKHLDNDPIQFDRMMV
jgi:hypothetical protein